jgi:RND superfamily putative drug exporter
VNTESIVRFSATHGKLVFGVWAVAFVVAGLFAAALLQKNLSTQWRFLSTPESRRADNLIRDHIGDPFAATEAIVLTTANGTVDDGDFRAAATSLVSSLNGLGPGVVESVTSYLDGSERLISEDRTATVVLVRMAGDADEAAESVHRVHAVVDAEFARRDPGATITGNATLSRDFIDLSEQDLQTGEVIGVPIALAILLVVFGTVVASLIPVLVAVVSIVIALGLAALIGEAFQLSVFVVNVATMMGLAVGIDYSLFIIERFREERRAGLSVDEAIARSGATASRAVLFSGVTVVLAITGLFFVPTDLFWSLAIGAALVVTVAVLVSLTLLPAVLAALGDRINRFRVPLAASRSSGGRFWGRAASIVMGRPAVSLLLAAGVLIAAAIPYLDIETGLAGVTSLPADARSREGFDDLDRLFSGGMIAPVLVVVDAPATDPDVAARAIAFASAVGGATVTSAPDGAITLISFTPAGDSATADAATAIRRLREEVVPATFGPHADRVFVSGWAARQADFTDVAARLQLPVVAFVLSLSFVLLMLVFRSVVVPLKAVIMNLLSVGAAYGLIVLVFQKGYGNEIFGFQQVDVIESWIPIFLFSILFGLSMDYHVFLLSRIRERYAESRNNPESVAFGIQSTGRIITGAALIMVFVFGGFGAGQLTLFQQMGFGLAVAVALDATLVRLVLVPAAMRLFGPFNWYLPARLGWLPRLNVEGSPERASGGSPAADRPGGGAAT